MMESNIQRLRNYYAEFRKAAYASETKQINNEKLKQCKNLINAEKNHINETGDIVNLEEVTYYEEKFKEMTKLMKKASNSSYSKSQYFGEMKEILKDEKYSFGNSYLKNQSTPP